MVERGRWRQWCDEHLELLGAGLVFVATQAVYLQTMTLSCPFWDSGEFIATSYILGIPHPPGTPLYVLIGRLFSLFPLFSQVATRVNWLSALASSLAAVFTYLLAVEFWRRGSRPSASEEGALERWAGLIAGLVAAFFVAFSRTFWDNAIEAEVYALSSLIMALSVWLILRWARAGGSREEKNGLFILSYYLLCLSMGIHLGTFLVLPGIVLFVLLEDHRSLASGMVGAVVVAGLVLLLHPGMLPTLGIRVWLPVLGGVLLGSVLLGRKWPVVSGRGLLLWCLWVAILGISTHFYLTIRAYYGNPAINEADPQTWDALWKVLTRDQYKPPNPFLLRKASWGVQLGRHFWDYARDQYALGLRPAWMGWYLPYGLGLVGAVGHFFREKKGFWLLLVSYLVMSLGLVFYLNFQADEVRDRDYFFVAAFQFFAIWIGLGAGVLWRGLGGSVRSRWGLAGAGLVLVLMPWMTCRQYWYEHDRTGFYVARDFAYNMLVPLKPNAILFTNGDNDTFPLWYLQEVEKIRLDVRVANLSLLNTDWYIRQLRDQQPRIDMGWSNQEILRLQPYIDSKTQRVVRLQDIAAHRIVAKESGKRPIYVATTVPDLMGLEDRLVMEGVVFELMDPVPGSPERIDVDLTLHNLNEVYKYRGLRRADGAYDTSVYKDDNARRLVQNYSAAYLRAAEEKMDQGDKATAEECIRAAEAISPQSRPIRYSLGILLLRAERYAEAEQSFQELLRQGMREARLYLMLGHAQEAQSKLSEAEQSYREALLTEPNDFQSLRELFSYLWQVMKKRAEAVEVLRDWSQRHPEDKRVAAALREFSDSLATPGGSRDAGR